MTQDLPPDTPSTEDDTKLDELLLAMDVVDTLRHREQLVLRELDGEAREKELIKRLKAIYAAQGITVPDATLKEGVKALEENRFAYTPPPNTFWVRLAHIYVNRGKWLKPVTGGLCALLLGGLIWHFGVSEPRKVKAEQRRIELAETLPQTLRTLRDEAQAIAVPQDLDNLAEAFYRLGVEAVADADKQKAETAVTHLKTLIQDLSATYVVRIVSRPSEYSGLFRIHEDNPNIKNYYLIVEAVDQTGRILTVPIESEENQSTKRVAIWGVRVPKQVFDSVSADKLDDQIIQNAVVGQKPVGVIAPDYSIETRQGAIFEW